jgi:hypothetical protein
MKALRCFTCLSVVLIAGVSISAVAAPAARESKPAKPPAVLASDAHRGDDPAGPIERVIRKIRKLIAGSTDDGNILIIPHP